MSDEALDDHFRSDNGNKLQVFRENRQAMEEIARRRYLSGNLESDGSVWIRSADISDG